MKSFDEFKKYHNANYHDGDSTFDELNYKKSNGDDFDIQFVQDCYDHFEAGKQSKQAEVDGLRKRIDICERLRDSQFEKLWNLTKAIQFARNGADEDFDLFLNHIDNILKGDQS